MFWYPKDADYDVRDAEGTTLRDFLKSYDPGRYERPCVTVDSLVFRKDEGGVSILLVQRGRHPSYGMLALPGGFVEMHEPLEASAARELFEETGLRGLEMTQLGAYGDPGRDPRTRIITIAYMSIITKDVITAAGDDADDAAFYRVSIEQKRQNMETIYQLSFKNERKQAAATVVETAGKRVIAQSGIASDHAIIILDGLERLGSVENK